MTIQSRVCTIIGGHGEIFVDVETGHVTGSNLCDEEYGRIVRFDVGEFKRHYSFDNDELCGLRIHIRDVGFWEGESYTAPEEFHRAEVRGELLTGMRFPTETKEP